MYSIRYDGTKHGNKYGNKYGKGRQIVIHYEYMFVGCSVKTSSWWGIR